MIQHSNCLNLFQKVYRMAGLGSPKIISELDRMERSFTGDKLFQKYSKNNNFLMSGKLNKQEQVQVVIRLKPWAEEQPQQKCVYVSDDQDKTLVVETPYKKQFFVFDNIANEDCSQFHLYQEIGKEVLKSSTQGFNCCIFAYGQTGAGKTYSILGKPQDLGSNIYCESRGILPRLLSDLFQWYEGETDRAIVKCSYMEIYNEQIFDLLHYQQRNHQIREDLKRGVFVEGLTEEKINTYQQVMNFLLKGIKNRKISQTSMNKESSRSHTIFTLNIYSEVSEGENLKYRKSKVNIVDLAGSQRAKQTKVEGDRLKQGCNINKSLHVLGNVINALVQSSKKKKHIPFRDSKLTHFLKDSLCGNSITKLLANVHPSRAFLGQTLSTLMFAKRAKILKLKVQLNENVTQNFEQLRRQIKRLREELAEARYIKNESKMTERNMTELDNQTQSWQRIIDISGYDMAKNENALKIFEENQINYKALMEIYEEHMKICSQSTQLKKNINIHKEWKNIEKKNQAYKNILKNMPAFTKIFKENILLRKQITKEQERTFMKIEKDFSVYEQTPPKKQVHLNKKAVNEIVAHYEDLLKQIQQKFTGYLSKLETAYQEIQAESKSKDEKIKDLMKRKELPPDLEELKNENQYLKLNVMELQDENAELQGKLTKYQIQIKQLKKSKNSPESHRTQTIDDYEYYFDKLTDIRANLQQDLKLYEEEKKQTQQYIQKLKIQLVKSLSENKLIKEEKQTLCIQNKELKRKINELLKIENQTQITKQNTNTFWTNEESTEEFMQMELFYDRNNQQRNKMLMMMEKSQILREKLQKQLDQEEQKTKQLSNEIFQLHQNYGDQIISLKEEIRSNEKKKKQIIEENYKLISQLRQNQTHQKKEEKGLNHTKSYKALVKYKESEMGFPPKSKDKSKKQKIDELRRKISSGNIKKTGLRIKQESKD